jgi:hypothetical protein
MFRILERGIAVVGFPLCQLHLSLRPCLEEFGWAMHLIPQNNLLWTVLGRFGAVSQLRHASDGSGSGAPDVRSVPGIIE